MPELPEVETTRRGIEPLIANKVVEKVFILNGSLRWAVPEKLTVLMPGQRFISVERRSKYLLFNLSQGTMIVHLGMTGHLRVDATLSQRRKHDHVEITFTDGTCLRYNDTRRFGSILWTEQDPLQHVRIATLGPEPFDETFNADYLYQLSRNRKVAVKPFLMDAHVVVGVGNIYASEALFKARIAPLRPAGKVSKASYLRIVDSVKEILEQAIKAGGTTIRDFSNSDGNPGYFKQELRVYGRAGQKCTVCDTLIKQIKLGQRSTFYCPTCQH